MSCILKCNDNDEIVIKDSDNIYNKTHDYVEKPSVMYKPSTVVPPNNILEITPPKDLEYPITFYPTVDTFFDKDNNTLVTLMELPGFPISDIEINIGDGEMIVSGTLRCPRPKDELYEKFGDNLNIQIRERKVGFFYRRFKLPNNAMDNTATACYDNGILSIIIKCSQFSPIRRIEVTNTPNHFNNKKNNQSINSIDNNNEN
ncbi:small heat-shock (HSP) protein, putative [Theileria annulata]|uniref:Small heat-shock (HSP) protein, putative n=1 Tax=Theileria annulata TaxID=5874 RepID=Q4UAC8_THEAN|nr:small heat-shock (HSP) protein, putative [Theileria annulata]CAI76223.1 small heat-shock (HSP) protein, putative [Theileria annulata]|eukprot:XP_952848.1 small heat-shock (HSP) protein, putative [Theileria annulata]